MTNRDNSNNIVFYNNKNKRLYFNKTINHKREILRKTNLNKKIDIILNNMKENNNSREQNNKNFINALDLSIVPFNKNINEQNTEQNRETPVLSKEKVRSIFDNYGNYFETYFINPYYEKKIDMKPVHVNIKAIESPLKNNVKDNVKDNVKNKVKKKIQKQVECLQDLIDLIDENPLSDEIEYNIDMNGLHNIKGPLCELSNMIGMNELKNSILDQIIYFAQDFHKKGEKDFMHTVIYGPPGTGKTEIAKIIGKIFSNLGILKKNKFKKVTRSDLVAGYLGQTAIKTKEVIQDAIDGVLFIDEAYALGNSEKKDSFAKECIDTLCEALSDNKDRLMVIIAGYEEQLNKCFFSFNNGLDSRFTWRFKTDDYTSDELRCIFEKKVLDNSWSLKSNIQTEWFENNKDYFKFYGRDMETLFAKTKIVHSRRVFCLNESERGSLTLEDLDKGLELFLKNDEVKQRKQDNTFIHNSMYN